MPQQLPKEIREFQEIKRQRKEVAIATNNAPGARDTYLETRGFEASAETLALNVARWRADEGLDADSVQQSLDSALLTAMELFPGAENTNTALQMLRWKKKRDRAAARRA